MSADTITVPAGAATATPAAGAPMVSDPSPTRVAPASHGPSFCTAARISSSPMPTASLRRWAGRHSAFAGAVGDVLPNRALDRVIWHAVKGGAFVLNGTRSCAAQLVSYLALHGASLTGTPISRKPSGDVTLDVWQAGLSDAAGVIRHLRWYQRQQEARTRARWRPPQPLPDVLDRGT